MLADPPALDTANTALFLDVDGTLLEIQARPSEVVVDAALLDLLRRLERSLGGAMALVSGRSLIEIDRLFGRGRFNAGGAHGAEVRLQGRRLPSRAAAAFPEAIQSRLMEFADSHEGLLLEQKPGGVSLHYRGAPALESACRDLMLTTMVELGDDYRLIAGKMVFEITPVGHDKGAAVHALMSREPFAGRTALFVGDDVTDEDGFKAANALNGSSILVGERKDSVARFALEDVAAVHRWLEDGIRDQQNKGTVL